MAIDYFAMSSLGAYTEDSVSGDPVDAEWMSLMGTWGAFSGAPLIEFIGSIYGKMRMGLHHIPGL